MPAWLTIVLALGGSTLIGCVVTTLYNAILHGTNKSRRRKEQEEKDNLKSIIQKEIAPIIEMLENNTKGTITVLRDRMKCSLNYCLKQGYATTSDKANGNELFNAYKDLGGNYFKEYVNQWKNEMDSLPLKEDTDKGAK